MKGEAGNKDAIQISALSQGTQPKRVRQRRKRSPGCTGSADLPSEGWEERHLGRSRSSRGAPGSRGQARRAARLGAVLKAPTERTAQEITAPFRPRLRHRGRSRGAPSVRKNSQTRPRAAGDHSSRPPPVAVQAVQVRAGASARTRAAGVRRGLGRRSSGLYGSPRRRRPRGPARCCAPSPCFQVCARRNCACSRRANSSGAAGHPRASAAGPARGTL